MLEKIKASAGSGKTYTLTQRFLQLLAELSAGGQDGTCSGICRKSSHRAGSKVFSEILAMTFTNKAAAEMKIRVIEALKKLVLEALARPACFQTPANLAPGGRQRQASLFDEPPPPSENSGTFGAAEASAWLEAILKRYDSLNIRTIDSLLAMLVRISAISLGIPPDFEISFDDAAYLDPLYDELQDRAAAGEPEICELLEECAAYLIYHTQFQGFTPRERLLAHIREVLSKLQDARVEPCLDGDPVFSRLAGVAASLSA